MQKASAVLRRKPAAPTPRKDYNRSPNDSAVSRLLRKHRHLVRLRDTHPALVVALAQEVFGTPASDRAIAELRHGASVDAVMRTLRLAPWLNQFSEQRLQNDLVGLPTSKAFSDLMTRHPLLPCSDVQLSDLLFSIRLAHRHGGEQAAATLLPFLLVEPEALDPVSIVIMSTFIAALHAPTLPAHRLIVEPPDQTSLLALKRGTVSWLTLLLMAAQFGPGGAPRWRDVSECRGHDLTWLCSATSLVELARSERAERPDAAFHAPYYCLDLARLITVARDGNHLGHAELRLGGRHRDEIQVYRVDGPDRDHLDAAARRAVHALLGADPPPGHGGEPDPTAPHLDADRLRVSWSDLMGPHLKDRAADDIFPSVLTPDNFVTLFDAALDLATDAGLGNMLADAIHEFNARFV